MKVIDAVNIQQIKHIIHKYETMVEDIGVTCAGALTASSPIDLLAKKTMDGKGKESLVSYLATKLNVSDAIAPKKAEACSADAFTVIARKLKEFTDINVLLKLKAELNYSKFSELVTVRINELKKLMAKH